MPDCSWSTPPGIVAWDPECYVFTGTGHKRPTIGVGRTRQIRIVYGSTEPHCPNSEFDRLAACGWTMPHPEALCIPVAREFLDREGIRIVSITTRPPS